MGEPQNIGLTTAVECPICEEMFPDDSGFKQVEGWWARPYPDIEWDWLPPGQPETVFTTEEPVKEPAWLCPTGCIMRRPDWREVGADA